MPYYVYAWLTNLFYGLGSIAGKLSSKHQLKNPWLLNFVLGLLVTASIVPLALFYHVQIPIHWGPILLAGLFCMLAGTFYILAMYQLDISVISPLYAFRSVFMVILGGLLFQERMTGMQLVYIGIIFVAGLVVSTEEHFTLRSFVRPGIGLAFLAILCSAIYSATLKNAMRYEGFWEVSLWNNLIAEVITLVTLPLFFKDMRKTPIHLYGGVFVTSIGYTLGALTQTMAYAQNIGLTSAILAVPVSMIMAFVFSIIAPKLLEKHTLKVYAMRFTAAAVMIIAALRLSG